MRRFLVAMALSLTSFPSLAARPHRLPEHVIFEKGHADITAGQERALAEVKAYLDAKPEVTLLRVAGHHDAAGHHALAVARWLVSHGVSCKRLLPVGFPKGQQLPHGGAYVVFVDAQVGGKTVGARADAGGKHAGDPCGEQAAGGAQRGHAPHQKGAAATEHGQAKSARAASATAPAAAGGKRAAIIAKAREYIGAVADQGGEGGKRKGWQLLKDIYDTSYNMDIFTDPKAKAEIPKAGGKYNSWCGIFALAMAKKSGAVPKEAHWLQGVGIKGVAHHAGNKGTIKPGDIIVMEMGGLWHHAIVASIEGDTFHTIDGNATDMPTGHTQTICEKTRQRKEISEWYETVPGE